MSSSIKFEQSSDADLIVLCITMLDIYVVERVLLSRFESFRAIQGQKLIVVLSDLFDNFLLLSANFRLLPSLGCTFSPLPLSLPGQPSSCFEEETIKKLHIGWIIYTNYSLWNCSLIFKYWLESNNCFPFHPQFCTKCHMLVVQLWYQNESESFTTVSWWLVHPGVTSEEFVLVHSLKNLHFLIEDRTFLTRKDERVLKQWNDFRPNNK